MKLLKLSAICASMMMLGFTSAFAGMVNINKADSETLAHNLKGIGEKKAEAIIEYRTTHGVFTDIEDLMNVKGIGEGILKKNLQDLSLSEGAVIMSGEPDDLVKPAKEVSSKSKKPVSLDAKVDKKLTSSKKEGKKLASSAKVKDAVKVDIKKPAKTEAPK